MADIVMPQLGETVTEGTITKWFKQVGDQVAEDDVLFEVSTDKVDSEVPSPSSGYLAEILVAEGDTVDVGTRLAVISDAPPAGGEVATPSPEATPVEEAPPAEAEAEAAEAEAAPPAEPAATAEVAESAPAPRPEADVAAAPEQPAAPAPAPVPAEAPAGPVPAAGKLLSPVVRRLIAEHGLDPASISGTGAGGRITRNDVLAVVERGGEGTAPAAKPVPDAQAVPSAAVAPPPLVAARAGERDTAVPLSNIRKRTGEHMVRSKATSPHVMASIEVDYEGVERVRRSEREAFRAEEGFGLTYLPFVSRAVVDAIREFPELNATMGDGELIVHNYVNLGIAVDLDFKGLIVPVIHDADGKRMRAIAREVSDLAGRARGKKLSADDISGGTFTITNPGPYGTLLTMPIINQPQVAILSTDGVKRKPVVVTLPDGSESIAIHSVGNLALTWDHRAFDGAYASAFIAKVKEIVETRDWAAEL